LKIFAAMQTGAQNEVAIEQRTRLTEKRKEIFAHCLGSARASRAGEGAFASTNFFRLCPPCGPAAFKACRRSRRNVHRRRRPLPRNGIILAGSVVSRLLRLIHSGNNFNFHVSVLRQRGDLDSGTRRGILFEIRTINFVHELEII
jgi:hypothetical protein